MKKALAVITVAFVLLLATVLFLREPLLSWAGDQVSKDMFVPGDTDGFDPGMAVGQVFPPIRARYQGEMIADINQLSGAAGTVLVASRSLDWCPYCRAQMIQLNTLHQSFLDSDIALLGMTYDDPALQAGFAQKFGISIPLLSDVDGVSFATLGILNQEYVPGDAHYGIPYPGIFVITPGGKVVGKMFLESYSVRVESSAVLAYARAALGLARDTSAQ